LDTSSKLGTYLNTGTTLPLLEGVDYLTP